MATSPHTFDQRSWRIIKGFVGIYGIKMDYSKIAKLSRENLSKAYFKIGNLPVLKVSITLNIVHDLYGNPRYEENINHLPAVQPKTAKEWKATILKRAAQGYKNRQFYEAVAKLVAPPQKATCICGLKMGGKSHQQDAHFRTRNHVNRMLRCVPLSKVADSKVPVWNLLMGNSHTLVVRKWSNQHRQFLIRQIDLRHYMEQRDSFQAQILDYCRLTTNSIKKKLWDRSYFTMSDILFGGWSPY